MEPTIGQSIGREGKILTGLRRFSIPLCLLVLVVSAACRGKEAPAPAPAAPRALVASLRSEPRSFNRYVARDFGTEVVSLLTQARLVRINRKTQELEPALAESWTAAPDGRSFTLRLRQGVRFSDGVPFTSADVLFAFRAIYALKNATVADSVKVDGKPLEVSAPDADTVVVKFPAPFGPGLRLLDNLPILPAHKLQAALDAGTFETAWGLTTPVGELAGLGPFVVKEYVPGQRLVCVRNPHYWRKAADGSLLPQLDRLTLEIVPDQNAELLRLQSGQVDFTQTDVPPDAYSMLKQAADAGKVRLIDLGIGPDPDVLWFNLRVKATPRKPWIARAEFRRAVSHAVDRKAFGDTVFLGAALPAYGPITEANTRWFDPDLPKYDYDPAQARALLAGIGLKDRNGDGLLEDASGAPVRFTLLTSKSRASFERGATFVRDELKKVGVTVDVAVLEVGALVERLERGDYEASYFSLLTSDLDPALNLDFWLSSGQSHVWNSSQKAPTTEWEKQIDQVMQKQVATVDPAERKALFNQAQRILAEQQPVLYFAAPRLFVAVSPRVSGAVPAVLRPTLAWNADELDVQAAAGRR